MSVRRMRVAAALVPAALLLHEVVYAVSGDGNRGSHAYLHLAVPALAVVVASVATASLILPLLGARDGGRSRRATPLALAAALVAIFAFQELTEACLLGGGPAAFGAALAAAWLLPPVALLFGALAASAICWLERTGELLLAGRRAVRSTARPRPGRCTPRPGLWSSRLSPLAFGLARRPPPGPIATP